MAGNGGIIGPDIVISNSIASPSPVKNFTSSGTYSSPSTVFAVDYLIVAGGGGGGAIAGGGGGGGGLVQGTNQTICASTNFTITVGGGGTGRVNFNGDGS